jgi:hypothetical protein
MKLEEACWLGHRLGLKVNPPKELMWVRACKCGSDGVAVRITGVEEFYLHCRKCRQKLQHIMSPVKMIGFQEVTPHSIRFIDSARDAMKPIVAKVLTRYMRE